MLYRSFKPGPRLGLFVDHFWLYDGYAAPHSNERILPSGTVELVINLSDDELRIYDLSVRNCRRFSGAAISGAYGWGFVSDTAEEASIMGVHFKPGGAFPFFGLPVDELADTHVDLETLWGSPAIELRERLCAAFTTADRFRLVEEALVQRLFCRPEGHPAVPVSLDKFNQVAGNLRVGDAARHVGLSKRRFIQVFKSNVGMTPKLYCRILRFQHARTLLEECALPNWASLAADCGYFDQSHLIRDFLEFSGSSPASYARQQVALRQLGQHVKHNHLPLPLR